ncbi:MAG: PP2C family protein-serine/threonine phosphatase [Bacteroidota bacterium]
MKNVYNTNDPQKLLELKRLEAFALLDVLRTINQSELTIDQMCLIGRNVLLAQLQVRKMVFFYLLKDRWHQGIRTTFDALSEEDKEEFMSLRQITRVDSVAFPGLFAKGVEYVVPIINKGVPHAFFLIADFAETEVEAQNDLIFIETLGHMLSVAIRNRQLFEEKIAQEYLRKELEVAGAIQKQLLFSAWHRFRSIDVYGTNVPHHGVGGDFFDVLKRGKASTLFCIADVSGKGIAAALLMSNLQANFRALSAQYTKLADIVRELNKLMLTITEGEKFVTFFVGKIDHRRKTLTYINAGHNPPIFMHEGGLRDLTMGCLVLGAMPEIPIQQEEIPYTSGDGIILFTDGVVDQTNQAGEMMGRERIVAEGAQMKELAARKMVEKLQAALDTFAEGTTPTDDITLMAVKFA